METHCIDVFFKCGKYPIHVLTSGSILPEGLNNILRNRTLQEIVDSNGDRVGGEANAPKVSVNTQYARTLIDKHNRLIQELTHKNGNFVFDELPFSPNVDHIMEHFSFYARQGFYSYDCETVNEDGTAVYRLMAWPDNLQHVDFELPCFVPDGFEDNVRENMSPEELRM